MATESANWVNDGPVMMPPSQRQHLSWKKAGPTDKIVPALVELNLNLSSPITSIQPAEEPLRQECETKLNYCQVLLMSAFPQAQRSELDLATV